MVDPQVLAKVKTVERAEVAGGGGEEEAVGIKTRSGKRSFPAAKVGDSGGVRCGGGGIVDDAISRKRKKKVYDAATPPPLVNPSKKKSPSSLSHLSPVPIFATRMPQSAPRSSWDKSYPWHDILRPCLPGFRHLPQEEAWVG